MIDKTRTDMSTYHLATSPDLGETQKTNAAKLIIMGLDNLVDPVTGNLIPNASDILKESAFQFKAPSFSQQPIEVRIGNTVIKSAGTPTFSDASITLHDFVGMETYNVLYAWQNLSFNTNTYRTGLMPDYKKSAYVLEYSTDFSKIVGAWKLEGVWVSALDKDGFDISSTANEVKINCSLSYDFAKREDPNQFI